MQKTYTLIEIYEADFGCEERPEVYYATPKCNKVQCKSVTP